MKRKRPDASTNKSSKARQAPNLAFKLHETTQAKPTGLGKAVAAQPRSLGQGKRRVWIGAEEAEREQEFRPAHLQLKQQQTISIPSSQVLQAHWIGKLRKWFRLVFIYFSTVRGLFTLLFSLLFSLCCALIVE